MGRDVSVVLKGRGGVMRLESEEVRVVRGRVTSRIPLRALGAVERHGATSVRLRISGDTSGDGFRVSGGNSNAVGAFTEVPRRAAGGSSTQESTVTVLMRRRSPAVDVIYDPQKPSRVRGGRALAHVGAGVFVAVLGSLAAFAPLTGFVVAVLDSLPHG
ncbi:hypothetical protein ACWD1Z_34050 [Streptomyces sp. NPDC002784]